MPHDDRRTARQRRDDGRAALSRVLRRSLAQHDVSQKALALAVAQDASVVQAWTDSEDAKTPHVADLPLFADADGGAAVARDLLEHIAGQLGLEVRDRADVEDDTAHGMRRHAGLQKEVLEALDAHIMALVQKGPASIATAIKELREARRKIDATLAVFEKAAGAATERAS